ncbi:hypothetical protein [Spirillospora sp. NPDC047279]|uniref:hypothetical protein n=1 Tax=Spirillospora sp. NPDC047279 TaxID=3155478 RepID=UPI0033D8FC3B
MSLPRATAVGATSLIASTPAPAPTVTAKPTATVTKTVERHVYRAPEEPDTAPGSFVDDRESAGIRAPSSWATDTALKVCEAWPAGRSTSSTDAILPDGGIYDDHLRDFSDIIESWFCPGAQP